MKKEKILYLLIIICITTITILTGITFIQSKKIQMIETQLTSISTTPNENSTKDVSKKINELESLANESFDIELFFKDLAKYCKNAIVKKELDIDKGLKIISTIYDVIGKFKFEDDKKLVGYVIVAEILSNTKQAVVKVVTTTQTNVNPTNSSIEETKKDKVNIKLTISDVKNNWNSILAEANNKRLSYRAFLMGASPIKIENNILFINYDRKFKFAKEQMETPEYSQEFTKIVREFFNEDNLEIKYEVVGQKKDEENNNSEFFKKIENYFKGEN